MLFVVAANQAHLGKVETTIRSVLATEIAAGTLSKWAFPEEIRFVREIAKTSVGKIDKKALRSDLN